MRTFKTNFFLTFLKFTQYVSLPTFWITTWIHIIKGSRWYCHDMVFDPLNVVVLKERTSKPLSGFNFTVVTTKEETPS